MPISLSPGTRKRIAKANIHNGKCNLCKADPQDAIVVTQLIDPRLRRSPPHAHLVDSFEWHWGMRKNTLNLYTRDNFFHLREDYAALFEEAAWFLLPDPEVLRLAHRAVIEKRSRAAIDELLATKQVTEDGKPFWRYRLVSFPRRMDRLFVYYHVWSEDEDRLLSVDAHPEPFDTLPRLELHVPPTFAILNTGAKLDGHSYPEDLVSLYQRFPELSLARDIYLTWCEGAPADALQDPSFTPQERTKRSNPSGYYWNDGSDYTPSGRSTPIRRPRSPTMAELINMESDSGEDTIGELSSANYSDSEPAPSSPKRQRLASALQELDRQSPPPLHNIMSWRSNIEDTPESNSPTI